MEKKSLGKGLEDISNVFLSRDMEEGQRPIREDSNSDGPTGALSKDSIPFEGDCEVEERINAYRRIAYTNSDNAQQDLRKTLFNYLEQGYYIRSVTLTRTNEIEKPHKRESKEDVTIYVKSL
jgi:hypothetical protein